MKKTTSVNDDPSKKSQYVQQSQLTIVRSEIDKVDDAIAELVKRRLMLVQQVVNIKEELKLPTVDLERESKVIARICATTSDTNTAMVIAALYKKLFALSRKFQILLRK